MQGHENHYLCRYWPEIRVKVSRCTYHSCSLILVRPLDAITYLFPVAVILLLADLFLTLTWSEWYFTVGPVVFRSIRFVAGTGPVPSAEALQDAATSFFFGRILFRDFGAYTFAFRRSLLAGSSLVNGLLEFNPQHHTVVVHARFAPFSAAFIVAWFSAALLTAPLSSSPWASWS